MAALVKYADSDGTKDPDSKDERSGKGKKSNGMKGQQYNPTNQGGNEDRLLREKKGDQTEEGIDAATAGDAGIASPVNAGDRSTKDKGGDPADAADSSRPFVCKKLLHGDFKGAIILQFLCTIHGGGDVHLLSSTSGYRCIHSSRILAGQPSLIEKLVSLSMAQAEYSIRKCYILNI
ncbi:uncharacterized protein LOC119357738 [Triticum dicoccoides]|uniref:uncharacterized protein LOC119357738 n=1 Tax=Triticum dicoccoides TaxID=85692 RepID=UPI00188F6089|nr:uncharacterized protein LOC119357738 [Triticum dicoccoides]